MSGEEMAETAFRTVRQKYGGGQLYSKNNQKQIVLPNGEVALVKVGANGQCMQIANGTAAKAPLKGGLQKFERVIIAVRGKSDTICRVYDVPVAEYIDQMHRSYEKTLTKHRNKPSELRVLRFDDKGYPDQRVADIWVRYLISPYDSPPPTTIGAMEPKNDPKQAIEEAKSLVADALGVSPEQVSITVTA
ncbi:MAG: hypothetical protein RIM84_21355 [Alphaproteobacteria bacterium]